MLSKYLFSPEIKQLCNAQSITGLEGDDISLPPRSINTSL